VSQVKGFGEDNILRDAVSNVRESIESVTESTKTLSNQAQATIDWAQQPSEMRQGCWNKVLEYRRKYPSAIVGAITALCLLPGLARKPSPRVLLRNSVIGGGIACILLYPELVMRTAPYVMKKARQMEQEVEQRIGR